ncbi:hypothetical protein [Fretibacter rubidus]|uniref:hypothetical protein n=1 Tax=Fretibacter rubidus TaxID=570162 RepID=UPI003529F46C
MTELNATTAYQKYDKPDDIVNDTSLTDGQKKSLLDAWMVDARALARASAEGLNGGEQPQLKSVTDALNALKTRK